VLVVFAAAAVWTAIEIGGEFENRRCDLIELGFADSGPVLDLN